MNYCLCIPEGSGIILDNALSKRTTGAYAVAGHHVIFLRSTRSFTALWVVFSHSLLHSTAHTQIRGLTYSVCSIIPLRRVIISSECDFDGGKIFCKLPLKVIFENVSLQEFPLLGPKPSGLLPSSPVKIFVSPESLDQSLLQEQSGTILAPLPRNICKPARSSGSASRCWDERVHGCKSGCCGL